MRQRTGLATALLLALLLSACGREPAPTPGLKLALQPTATPGPTPATAEDEVLAVVAAESEAVKQQDIDALALLWDSAGRVVDANHTASDTADDKEWLGWVAVQQRYLADVFPYVSEPVVSPRARVIQPLATVSGDEAEVIVYGPDGRTPQDRWDLLRTAEGWRIVSLTFNLLPLQ